MSGRAKAIAWKVVKVLANSGGLGWHVPPPAEFDRMHSSSGPQPEPRVDPRELDAWLAMVLGHDDPAGQDRRGRRGRRAARRAGGERGAARDHQAGRDHS